LIALSRGILLQVKFRVGAHFLFFITGNTRGRFGRKPHCTTAEIGLAIYFCEVFLSQFIIWDIALALLHVFYLSEESKILLRTRVVEHVLHFVKLENPIDVEFRGIRCFVQDCSTIV